MNTRTINRIGVTVLALACALLAWWNWRLGSQVGELVQENAELRPKLQKALRPARPSAATEAPAIWRANVEPADATAGEDEHADADANAARKRNFRPEEVTAMVKNPAMQTVIASQQAVLIQITYNDLMDRFKLSPEERDYMQSLLLERQMNLVTLGMQFMNPELSSPQRGELGLQIHDAEIASQAKIRDFLNDDADYARYQAYAEQEPERREIGTFESSLAGNEQLDPAVADALAGLMNQTRKDYPFTVDFYNQQNFGRSQVLNSASVNKFLDEQVQFQAGLVEKAAELLTPAQLEAFKQGQAATRQMMKMQLSSVLQMAGKGQ